MKIHTKIVFFLALASISFSIKSHSAEEELDSRIICETAVRMDSRNFQNSNGQNLTEDQLRKATQLCQLKFAAKTYFKLVDQPSEPSEIQKFSQEAEALCNVKVTMDLAVKATNRLEAKNKLSSCYLEQLENKINFYKSHLK